jgi:hypothetical protein
MHKSNDRHTTLAINHNAPSPPSVVRSDLKGRSCRLHELHVTVLDVRVAHLSAHSALTDIAIKKIITDYNDSKGRNYRLDTLHAAVLNVKLNYLVEWNRRRVAIADMYKHLLAGVGDIAFPAILSECSPVYHQFVINTSQREPLLSWLNDKFHIGSIMHYPVPIHRQKSFAADYAHFVDSIPLSDTSRWCQHILTNSFITIQLLLESFVSIYVHRYLHYLVVNS